LKKKKGSSLIFVLVTFAIIATFGFSILSLTLVSYKKRFVETTEKRNQYFSESGLAVSYGVIGKVIDDGVKSGNQAVDNYMNTLNGEGGILQQEKDRLKNCEVGDPNKVSNKESIDLEKYINPDGSSKYIEEDGITVKESYVKWQQNERFKNAYKIYVINNITHEWLQDDNTKTTGIIPISDENYKSQYEDQENNINKPSVEIYNKDNVNDKIAVEFSDVQNYRNTGKKQCVLPLYLRSTFTEKNVQKTITVDYDILTPDYNATYYTSTNNFKLPITSVWNNKAFCIDGDLKIGGAFNVTGDIYVKGTNADDGGININNNNSVVTLTGNASTSQNFKVSKPSNTVTVTNNIYAGGNVEIGEGADGAQLNVNNSIYTNNDLALDAKLSSVVMENFYGISDIPEVKGNNEQKVSSCIRVNTDDIGKGSSFTVNNEAILMGTAYIKTNDGDKPFYQTGESVAVKGNYRAYTEDLNSDMARYETDDNGNIKYEYEYETDDNGEIKIDENGDSIIKKDEKGNPILKKDGNGKLIPIVRKNGGYREDNVNFDYIDPFQLVTRFKDNTEFIWQDLSDYFTIYVREHINDAGSELNLGNGITLPMTIDLQPGERADKNIIHKGSIVANGNVYNGNYQPLNYNKNNVELAYEKKIAQKQRDFAGMVYEMGDAKDLDNAYAQGKVRKMVYSPDPNVAQITFNEIKNTTGDVVTKNSNNDIIYLNSDDSKNCVIVGKDPTNIQVGTQIKLDGNGIGRGIIITKGNVYMCGNIKFTGVIIAAGNVEVKDDNKKEFINDNSYIKKLIAYNYDEYFKGVFAGTPEINTEPESIETNVEINESNNVKGDVIRKNFIVMKNWKIEK
jgi:hypothetical protein